MVFSSIPPYLDPSNWQKQLNHPGGNSSGSGSEQLPPRLPLLPSAPQPHGGGTIRPGLMAERARLANFQMPEGPLQCPRCESTNTKFCYFNNYSLSQPRHFCKMCRRYWTRGGALRNVPVGGGCRRNKRSKGNSSKSSSSASSDRPTCSKGGGGGSGRASSGMSSGGGLVCTSDMLGFGGSQIPSLRLMPPLQRLNTDFGSSVDQIGLNFNGLPPSLGEAGDLNFPVATILGGGSDGSSLLLSSEGLRLPQVQQFPFLGGSNPYPFEGSLESQELASQIRLKAPTPEFITQFASVKMEDHSNPDLNLSRQFLGIQGNDQFNTWNTNSSWTDLSGFSSSSTSNPQ
ncbi:hypothetical protein SAY87_008480 [Trapa incisa]|uniref:Dof zinc finger protein n=1 Tax=Trapa incisa TaxID=236973 RepID=A0AAN7KLG8_9MYRT|nr:hypothetical protein SAY87_008480 [Trapa incisa]